MPGSVILLHGPSSAGKSTLARAIQAAMPAPFLRFSLDLFLFGDAILPARRDREGPFSRAAIRPRLQDGYYGCLAALTAAGNDLVLDVIIEDDWQARHLSAALSGRDVFTIGLHCPLPELERRERARGDRPPGDARRDLVLLDRYGPYDLDVDSSLPPERNAEAVIAAWLARSSPGRFQALADRVAGAAPSA
ncbi:chloramphenicol phosphotransferase CPT family protein [Roseomonas sp. CCTCC AB2023176]|uniref:chloramphenicol phosphotransferase CPT family protein n=1 Tax=Roseomonas sp. CCTCC AB2023176 TaxID=3342640 RepID=UPI0035DBF6A2